MEEESYQVQWLLICQINMIMQRTIIKLFAASALFSFMMISTNAMAQKKKAPAKKTTTPAPANANPFGKDDNKNANTTGGGTAPANNPFGGGATTQQPPANNPFGGGGQTQPPKTNSNQPPANNPFGGGATTQQPPAGNKTNGNIPIETIQSTQGSDPLMDPIRKSQRAESAIVSDQKERTPLPYDHIREDDAVYRQKLWKVIDAREKINAPFRYNTTEDNGNQLFFAIIYKAVTEDSVVAFEDERFTLPYKDIERFKTKFSGGIDTSDVMDLDGNVVKKEIRRKEFPIDSIYKFMVKEEIIFDKEAARLVHRIIGIAPMGPLILKGKVYDGPHFPYFWLYYPDIRNTLAKKQVYNSKNMGARMTWEDYLENHLFSYYIVKSTLDNFRDQKLDEYIKDPLFRLLEGDKIKDKIFSYEQSLWAY